MSTRQQRVQAYLNNVERRRRHNASPAFLGDALLAWWDPRDVATLFQDSAGTTPVEAVSDPVGLIRDKSGNGYDFSQTTAGARPLWQADGSLLFDGTAAFMNLESQPFPDAAEPGTIWAIVKQNALAADATNRTILAYGNGTANGTRNLRRAVTSSVNRAQINVGTGAAATAVADATTDFSGVHRIMADIGAAVTSLRVNDTTTGPTTVVPSTGVLRTRLGSMTAAGAANFWNGKIGPVVVTSALTLDQIEAMKRYYLSLRMD